MFFCILAFRTRPFQPVALREKSPSRPKGGVQEYSKVKTHMRGKGSAKIVNKIYVYT
jgi:hypothetical protein